MPFALRFMAFASGAVTTLPRRQTGWTIDTFSGTSGFLGQDEVDSGDSGDNGNAAGDRAYHLLSLLRFLISYSQVLTSFLFYA